MLLDLWGWVGGLKQGQATVLGLVGGIIYAGWWRVGQRVPEPKT